MEMYVEGTHYKHLVKVLLIMSTHNKYFLGEIKKNIWITFTLTESVDTTEIINREAPDQTAQISAYVIGPFSQISHNMNLICATYICVSKLSSHAS